MQGLNAGAEERRHEARLCVRRTDESQRTIDEAAVHESESLRPAMRIARTVNTRSSLPRRDLVSPGFAQHSSASYLTATWHPTGPVAGDPRGGGRHQHRRLGQPGDLQPLFRMRRAGTVGGLIQNAVYWTWPHRERRA